MTGTERPTPGGVARAMIGEAGGLVSLSGLARRWGMSKSMAHHRTSREGFPEPVVFEGGKGPVKLWFVGECEAWRESARGY